MESSPRRSCVSCRTVKSRAELIRVHALPGGAIGVDLEGGVGRGAYVCPQRPCLAQSATRGEFGRRLKVPLEPIQVKTLGELILKQVSQRVISLLGLARRARGLVSGPEAVVSALNSGWASLILMAVDASASSVGRIRSQAAWTGTICYQVLSQEELGAAVGVPRRSCVALNDSQYAEAILLVLAKLPREAGKDGAMEPRGQGETG